MSKTKKSAFGDLGDTLAVEDTGFGAMLAAAAADVEIALDDILVKDQERKTFDEEKLSELAENIKQIGLLQAICVRRIDGDKPYELIAGERRMRAARLAGLTTLRARVFDFTDEQARDARFAENIQRENLEEREEALRLKEDVDTLGMQATLAKHNKSHSWVSKRLALLDLPEQADRLVTEHISADPEVITQVATIERRDPKAAAEVVDKLKATRGKESARAIVAEAKEKVKPSKKSKDGGKGKTVGTPSRSNIEGSMATARDENHMEPGAATTAASWPYPSGAASNAPDDLTAAGESGDEEPGKQDGGEVFAHAKNDAPTAFAPADLLTRAYIDIFEQRKEPKKVMSTWGESEREDVENWLRPFYEAGVHCKTVSHVVAQNLRKGLFSTDNEGWFAMAAFLEGVAADTNFELLNILGSAKE